MGLTSVAVVIVDVCSPGNDDDDFAVVVVVVVVVIIVKYCPPVVLVEVSFVGPSVDGKFSPETGALQHIWESCKI